MQKEVAAGLLNQPLKAPKKEREEGEADSGGGLAVLQVREVQGRKKGLNAREGDIFCSRSAAKEVG